MKWLFLVHQVHTPNSRERVKVWRAIRKTGAILYRNSVYILPFSKEHLEDLQWVCQQINDSRGEASVFVSNAPTREEDAVIRKLFIKAREEDYAGLLASAERLLGRLRLQTKRKNITPRLQRTLSREATQIQETFEEIRKIDFFVPSPPKRVMQTLDRITALLASAEPPEKTSTPVPTFHVRDFQNKVWTTREDIHIDRLCSAWLIRRFIDPHARFVFAPEQSLPKGAVPFDVFGAEFSHHGEDCTFETLMKAFRIRDRAVREIAEIIHDIDLKDHKFERTEANGLDAIIRGLSASLRDDHRLLDAGSAVLDGLYLFFSKPPAGRKKR